MAESDRKFPDPKRLAEVLQRLSSDEVMGSAVLPENAGPIERAKFKACEIIVKFLRKSGMMQKELATRLRIDESRLNEILHYKVENFTLESLIGYANALYPTLINPFHPVFWGERVFEDVPE